MRHAILAVAFSLLAFPALAQDQQAPDQQEALRPPQAEAAQPIFDMVATDRETAWRINRVTGEMVVCRVETTASLDTVRARCTPAAIEAAQQTSGAGASRP